MRTLYHISCRTSLIFRQIVPISALKIQAIEKSVAAFFALNLINSIRELMRRLKTDMVLKVMLSTTISLLFLTSLLFSQNMMEDRYLQGMVNVDRTPAGTIFIQHIIGEGQSLYGISQFFDVPLYDIKRFNPDMILGEETVGMELKIPIDKKHLIQDLSKANRYAMLEKVFYTVKKGDTPYGIAKRAFSMKLEKLLELNGIEEADITVGRFLHVGWIPSVGLNHFGKPVKAKAVYYSRHNEAFRNEFTAKGANSKELIEERGAAYWNKSAGEDFDYYVMHRNAPKNTMIEITNPDTGRKIYTKVLGKIPPKYPNKVIIVVSPKVAKELGGVNANFFVSLSYHK